MSEEKIPFDAMLHNSDLMYTFASLRDVVNDHSKTFGAVDNGLTKVEFTDPHLIVTQNDEQDLESRANAFLRTTVSAADMLKFLELNRNFYVGDDLAFNEEWSNKTAAETDPLAVEKDLKVMAEEYDAEFWEYDDQFAERDLVYGLIINRVEKRIVIAFRGSATARDWLIDATVTSTVPKELKFANETGLVGADNEVSVHQGFATYLFAQKAVGGGTKFDDILKDLQDVYAYKKNGHDYSDFKLFITGHSLGGALSSLLSVALAGCDLSDKIPAILPVTALTYASPRVGGDAFLETHKALEKNKKLRHIRVSNDGDVVPVAPPFYMQTGLNIHLYSRSPAYVGYDEGDGWFFVQFRPWSMGRHSLTSYHDHLIDSKLNDQHVLGLSVKEMYARTAKIDV